MDMNMLNHQLVQEILSRLPVRSLMQSRSVCRLWRDLTSNNRDFTSMHTAQSLEAIPGLMQSNLVSNDNNLSHHYNEFFFIDRRINALTPTYFPLQFPIPNVTEFNLLDTCNGLILLISQTEKLKMYVCNPLIRKFIVLPDHSYPYAINISTDLDFGFCPNTKSYKVLETSLWVLDSNTPNPKYWTEKYVLKLGDTSWNRIDSDVRVITRRYGLSTNINGAFYWIDHYWGGSLTVFDLEHDEFEDMVGPVYGTGKFLIGIIENCVSVTNLHDGILDIWIRKENWFCWEKYCVIELFDDLDYHVLDFQIKGREFLIFHDDQIMTYNNEEELFKCLLVLDGNCNIILHYDTLISPLDF